MGGQKEILLERNDIPPESVIERELCDGCIFMLHSPTFLDTFPVDQVMSLAETCDFLSSRQRDLVFQDILDWYQIPNSDGSYNMFGVPNTPEILKLVKLLVLELVGDADPIEVKVTATSVMVKTACLVSKDVVGLWNHVLKGEFIAFATMGSAAPEDGWKDVWMDGKLIIYWQDAPKLPVPKAFRSEFFSERLSILRASFWDRWKGILLILLYYRSTKLYFSLFAYMRHRLNESHSLTEFSYLDMFSLRFTPFQLIPASLIDLLPDCEVGVYSTYFESLMAVRLQKSWCSIMSRTSVSRTVRNMQQYSYLVVEGPARDFWDKECLFYWVYYRFRQLRYQLRSPRTIALETIIRKDSGIDYERALTHTMVEAAFVGLPMRLTPTLLWEREKLCLVLDSSAHPASLIYAFKKMPFN
jgi:hypothetical protein